MELVGMIFRSMDQDQALEVLVVKTEPNLCVQGALLSSYHLLSVESA